MADNFQTTSPRTVLFAGGGSGGHLYPGLAVAERLRERRPDLVPLFLCTERDIDRVILEPSGFEFIPQPITPPTRSVGGLLRFWSRWRATNELVRKVLAERNPAAVLGLGGYAAGVAVKVAADKKFGVPAGILNPDVVPGKANLYLMQFSLKIFCGTDATLDHIPAEHRDKCEVSGCPLRSALLAPPPREDAFERLGLDSRLNTLVVTGASQGARTVNEAVVEVISRMSADSPKETARAGLQGWQVLHLAGRELAEDVRADWRRTPLSGRAKVIDFTPAMADVWAVADLAVARSGASTCAELLAFGVPAVLMPYPFHKDMHQRANAKDLEAQGAAVVIDDTKNRKTNADALRPTLEALLYNAEQRRAMATAAKAAARPDAADSVATFLSEMAGDPA